MAIHEKYNTIGRSMGPAHPRTDDVMIGRGGGYRRGGWVEWHEAVGSLLCRDQRHGIGAHQ